MTRSSSAPMPPRARTTVAAAAIATAAALGAAAAAAAAPSAPSAQPAPSAAAGRAAFASVARVLQSPRCQNCHPAGDAPLQSDRGVPHAMNVTRRSAEAGLPCRACHGDRNAGAGGPPGAPGWALPPADMRMVFEGRSPAALCEQLRDPDRNGGHTLAELVAHVTDDQLVRWAWQPGGGRTPPPLAHGAFVAAFRTWALAGAPCPAP